MRFVTLFVCLLLAVSRASAELVVGNPQWGFNGNVVDDTFTIVTFEVRNTGPAAFEGEMILDDGGMLGARSSAPYTQQVFIQSGGVRAVQFYPFVGGGSGSWRLRWAGQRGGALTFDDPARGAPAVVILDDPESPGVRTSRMRVFNEANFPPTVSATDSLHAVLLDHQPRWDAARRDAFLDWLKRGGLVHVLPGFDGTVPTFTNELAVLNVPEKEGLVGGGLVVRHNFPVKEATEESLAQAGYQVPGIWTRDYREPSNSTYFRVLSAVTKPNIAWGVIYLLTIIYVVLIGPVFYFLRKRDYRWLLGGFVGTVALFAWTFTVVGRRGYGEKQIYHTLAIARSLGDARWDVRNWVHAFATTGDLYRFTFPGSSHLYAASGDNVAGTVVQGKDAYFEADIPLFSSRPFTHQGVLLGPNLGATIEQMELEQRAKLKQLRIKGGPQFPADPISVTAQYREHFYPLQKRQETWALDGRGAQTFQDAFDYMEDQHEHRSSRTMSPGDAIYSLRSSAGRLARLISNDGKGRRQPTARPPRADQLRLFIYASAPPEFQMNSAEFLSGSGFVLYVQDLPAPSSPTTR